MKEFYTNNLHSRGCIGSIQRDFRLCCSDGSCSEAGARGTEFFEAVAALPSAPNLRRQQHASLLALLAKGLSFNSIQAAAVLEEISDEIWGEDLAPSLRTAVAQSVSESTSSELEPKRLGQDFTRFTDF